MCAFQGCTSLFSFWEIVRPRHGDHSFNRHLDLISVGQNLLAAPSEDLSRAVIL